MGDFQRYHYLQFDFTEITEEGLYQVMYGDAASPVFRIAKDVWDKGIWQAEVEYFLPVQMCHMRVNEKYRVWHDFCHQDDARMAQTNINHIDGYSQGPSTLCKYQPGDLVPGLNVGGWHDAGDYDLRVESQAGEAYILAMACENFGAYWDETSIDFEKRIVEIHQPDGKNDLLQQVENGALTVVAGWKALGRLYRGILCPTVRQYAHLGDASAHTDHVSGTADDRWVFTEDNPGRELQVAAWLAGISRVLKGHNDTLAADCLEIARELFKITRCDNNWILTTKVHAAVELYLATKEAGTAISFCSSRISSARISVRRAGSSDGSTKLWAMSVSARLFVRHCRSYRPCIRSIAVKPRMECHTTEVTVLPVHGSLSIWAITTVIYMLLILTYLHRTTFLMPSSICWVCIRDVTRQLL